MRLVSIVLLGLAGFSLYAAASGSLLCVAMGRSGGELAVVGLVLAIIAWIPFAVFLSLGLVCSQRGTRRGQAAITILIGALFTLIVWVTLGMLLQSPAFTATLQRGPDYASAGRLTLLACPALLLLIVPSGLHLRRMSREAGQAA